MTKEGISDRRKERLKNTVLNRLYGLTIVAEGTHLRHNLSAILERQNLLVYQKSI